MTPTYTARKISPMLAAADMEQTLAFYQDVLGFKPMMKSPEFRSSSATLKPSIS